MSDGTTAVQVSPIPTESEMTRIRQIFEYAANAIVRASELGKQVTELEGKFETLNRDYTSVMARNDELVTSLNEVRLQRDEAQSKLIEVRSSFDQAQGEIKKLNSEADFALNKINGLEEELTKLRSDSNHIVDEWQKESDRANSAEAKLKAIHKTLGIPEPKAEVAPQAEPQPITPPGSNPVTIEASAVANPEPRPLSAEETKPHTEQAPEVDYTKPYHWDIASNRWVND